MAHISQVPIVNRMAITCIKLETSYKMIQI